MVNRGGSGHEHADPAPPDGAEPAIVSHDRALGQAAPQ